MSNSGNIVNILGTFFCAIIVVILATVVPYEIVTSENHTVIPEIGKIRIVGPFLIFAGIIGYLLCFWNFIFDAKGMPYPEGIQKHLIVKGLYRYVRNPMYISWYLILLGEAIFFQSRGLLYYLLGWIIFFYFKVIAFEEPSLRAKFGESYRQYCKSVRRWIPRFKAYDANVKE